MTFLLETRYRKDKQDAKPTYICDKCGRKITEYRPIRLALQDYNPKYNAHQTFEIYDLCDRCYEIFDKWKNKNYKTIEKKSKV